MRKRSEKRSESEGNARAWAKDAAKMDERRCKRTVPMQASMLARHEAARVAWAATDSATHANAARTLSASLAHTMCVEMRRDCKGEAAQQQQRSSTASSMRQEDATAPRQQSSAHAHRASPTTLLSDEPRAKPGAPRTVA